MKGKNEVYVAVSSNKVAKKLKKVLEMFGEEVFNKHYGTPFIESVGNAVHFWEETIWAYCYITAINKSKTKVTVSELKQILFREHAKKGDVVIVDNGEGGSRWVLELTGNYVDGFEHSKSFDLKSGENDSCEFSDYIVDGKFIRYATEEEKALLNPKKELETGKWYYGNGEKLIFVSELSECGELARGYGIGANGMWFYDNGSFSWTTADLKEATKEEVEYSLRKESEKRGLVCGVKISPLFKSSNKHYTLDGDYANYDIDKNRLYVGGILVFHNGKWAEVIEQEKTLEQRVKELEDFIYGHKDFIAHIKGEDLQLVLERRK